VVIEIPLYPLEIIKDSQTRKEYILTATAFELMKLADKYKISNLSEIMQYTTLKSVAEQNIMSIITNSVKYPFCNDLKDLSIAYFLGSNLLAKKNIFADSTLEAVLEISQKAIKSTDPGILLDRIIEFAESGSVFDLTNIRNLIKEIVKSSDIKSFSQATIQYCMKNGIISMEECFEKLLKLQDERRKSISGSFNSDKIITYSLYMDEPTKQIKVKILKSEAFQNVSFHATSRSWNIPQPYEKIVKADYENIILKYFSPKNREIKMLCKLTEHIPNAFFNSSSFIIEDNYEGQYAGDILEKQRGIHE